MCRQFLIVAALLASGACSCAPNSVARSSSAGPPAEEVLVSDPGLVRDWKNRLLSDDPAVRAAAGKSLVDGGARSLPLLRRMLESRDRNLRGEAMEIVHCLGADAIPLLTEMLQDRRAFVRRQAIDLLVDLAPDTESIQRALRVALKDDDLMVARDAARALGALGGRAAESAPALIEALAHRDAHVRLYSAEALASIGPAAAAATPELIKALDDPLPGVRWGACEALAGIGPSAAPAVPRLIEALSDEFLYVRICAAGALGNIGPGASAAVSALDNAAKDPTLHAEASWALSQIVGKDQVADAPPISTAIASSQAAPSAPARAAGNPPMDWDLATGRNIRWSIELGGETYGRPVVSGGVVYIGADNSRALNPDFLEDCGTLRAFRASDDEFLWQDIAPRVKRGMGEFMLPSTTSAPLVEGERLYYVTAECQLRCLDARGFADGQNDGPYQSEPFQDESAADIIWELDMCGRLGVFPHEASNSDVVPIGNLLIVCTSNGRNEGHTRVPSPRAPSLIAIERDSGDVVWRAIGAGADVLHGQWCSPVATNIGGRVQVLFGGGDGWLRGYDAISGREIWSFDCNPKDARWLPRPGVFSRSPIIASPVYADGRVFVALGDDPSHGNGPSLLHAISPNGHGDVTESRRLWTSREIGRVVGTPIVHDGLLYVGDLGGQITCLDSATGALVWKHDTGGAIWGCLFLAGGRVYVGNVDGVMTVLRAGRRKAVLAEFEMDASLYSAPAIVGDALYLATSRRLHLISRP